MSDVNVNGIIYEMIERQGCNGCAFRNNGKCAAPLSAPQCYTDGLASMIFIKKEMACYGDGNIKPFVECSDTVREPARPFIDKAIAEAEWDAKYEIFESHYPIIKWAVVAVLLGLVWLASM